METIVPEENCFFGHKKHFHVKLTATASPSTADPDCMAGCKAKGRSNISIFNKLMYYHKKWETNVQISVVRVQYLP